MFFRPSPKLPHKFFPDPLPSSLPMDLPKPRLIIVGAGMSGLSAAHRIILSSSSSSSPRCLAFDLTILEASHRIGGRICSSSFAGECVEMGATWIHGIDGSPVHKIAQRIGSLQSDVPWECMDGFPETPVVKAEGGLEVHPSIVQSVGDLYRKLYALIQHTDGGLQQFSESEPDNVEHFVPVTKQGGSVGSYLREGLRMYLSAQENASVNSNVNHPARDNESLGERMWKAFSNRVKTPSSWNLRSLQEGVFEMRQNLERSVTAAHSLTDLDLESNDEYWEYPGEHQTIGKGYSSVVNALAAEMPSGTIIFGKRVKKIAWLRPQSKDSQAPVHVHCDDGTIFEADHVIVTVSLGVLKAEALGQRRTANNHINKLRSDEGQPGSSSLFEPPLPVWKLDVISRLGFGVVDKLFLLMNPSHAGATYPHMQFVFQPKAQVSCDLTPSIPWWMRKNFSLYPIHRTSHVLCTWFTGKEALKMESLSNKEVIDGALTTMASFGYKERSPHQASQMNGSSELHEECCFPKEAGLSSVREISRSGWGENPLFRGSYSYVSVGSNGEDIDTMAEPLPRLANGNGNSGLADNGDRADASPLQLLFAGEATHRFCYSTTHGAFLSGLREAERLLKHYGLLKAE